MSNKSVLAITLALITNAAVAHPQAGGAHAHDFFSGFAHPFTGLDHLLAMLAVGIWSCLLYTSDAADE